MTLPDLALDPRAQRLRRELGDRVSLPGDPGFDAARRAWNTVVDQLPFAVVRPETAEEVVDAVRAAVAAGLRVAPQSTGHAAAALSDTDLSEVVLISLAGLRGVTVDAAARTARVLGGSQWNDVIEEVAPHGLTALHGSAGDVSVAGYALSGGISFYGRTHGMAVHSVREAQIVTADGALVRAGAEENADLFWAVRGGSGAFGVVVSLEIDLLPYSDVYAGMLLWDAAHAPAVAHAWAHWTAAAPETATTSLRVLHIPPLPEFPPFLSGRSVIVIDGAILDSDEAAEAILCPLRDLKPEIDSFTRIPAAGLVAVHMDPPGPTPSVSAHAVLHALPDDAVAAFLAASDSPGLLVAELRHLGGAFARPVEGDGAVSAIQGEYLIQGIAVAPVPEAFDPATSAAQGVVAALGPWHNDALALTFLDARGVAREAGFGASGERLRALKHRYDPAGVFAAAHPV